MNALRELSIEQRLLYENRGGYSLGMDIAQEIGPEFGFSVPQQYTYLVGDNINHDEVLDMFPNGFGIKRSGINESFSPSASRGINSSRSHFWDGTDRDEGRTLIDSVVSEATGDSLRSLVFQEYIRGSKATVHATEDQVICEAEMSESRGLLVIEDNLSVVTETSPSDESQTDMSFVVLRGLGEAVKSMRRSLSFDCDIEFMVTEDTSYITQLRPIPEYDCLELRQNEEGRVNEAEGYEPLLHQTRFVNGIWRTGLVHTVNDYAEQEPFVVIKKHRDIRHCTSIMEALDARTPTLVLDPYSGFRLTHEPENLPRDSRLRKFFASISIAACDADIDEGQQLKITVNNDQGKIYGT